MNHNERFFQSRLRVACAAWVMLFSCFGLRPVPAQEVKLDISAIMHDTQKMTQENQELTLVWWIPEQFWKASFSSSGALTQDAQEKMLRVFRPYTLLAVLHARIGTAGAFTYEDEKEVRRQLTLLDQDEKSYKPLGVENYSGDLDNVLTMMKPVLAKAIGSMGQNLSFYVFNAKTAKGAPIADPAQKGKFSVLFGETKFTWSLPLSSVLPPKICPTCHESLSGAFNFCPFDGTPLPK